MIPRLQARPVDPRFLNVRVNVHLEASGSFSGMAGKNQFAQVLFFVFSHHRCSGSLGLRQKSPSYRMLTMKNARFTRSIALCGIGLMTIEVVDFMSARAVQVRTIPKEPSQ